MRFHLGVSLFVFLHSPYGYSLSQELGSFRIQSAGDTLEVAHQSMEGRVIWERKMTPGWLRFALAETAVKSNQGHYDFNTKPKQVCEAALTAASTSLEGQTLLMRFPLQGAASCQGAFAELRWQPLHDARLGLVIRSTWPEANHVEIKLASVADEGFYGFGLQPTYLNLKGQNVPIFSQEQGITRGRQPFTALVNAAEPGGAGTTLTSYMAAPQFITSRGRGLFLENHEYAEIDLKDKTTATIRLLSPEMRMQILAGATPLKLIEAYTSYSGRQKALPDWFHAGAIVGMQGGTSKVREVWQKLEARQTPVAGFWLQDWEGKRRTSYGSQLWWNWELDQELYSGWDPLRMELLQKNIRLLGYINPHLVDVAAEGKTNFERNLYGEAQTQGFLLKDVQGNDYDLKLSAFKSGIVDLTNPGARSWLKKVIQDELLGAGLSGWMCDYGESFPIDSKNHAGIPSLSYHNQFVEDWARLNQEALQEAGRDDVVFFCRAGYTRSPGAARLFWQGDQMVTWDANDGLKSAVIGLIGGGLSGYALNHSDIGGYTTLSKFGLGLKREKELLLRWMEFSAFTAAFRTHEGNLPEENVQFYTDSETLAAFDRNARLFKSLFFYRQELFKDSSERGYPLARALFLHYPEDKESWKIDDQYLLGRDILVAPIVEKGRSDRNVYLPAGTWIHVWTGKTYGQAERGQTVKIPAPLGQIPAFYRADSNTGTRWVQELKVLGLLP
jgi:alpha-glucosidase